MCIRDRLYFVEEGKQHIVVFTYVSGPCFGDCVCYCTDVSTRWKALHSLNLPQSETADSLKVFMQNAAVSKGLCLQTPLQVKTEFTAGLPKLWVYGTDTKTCEYRVNYSDIDKTVEPTNKTFIDTQSQNQPPTSTTTAEPGMTTHTSRTSTGIRHRSTRRSLPQTRWTTGWTIPQPAM